MHSSKLTPQLQKFLNIPAQPDDIDKSLPMSIKIGESSVLVNPLQNKFKAHEPVKFNLDEIRDLEQAETGTKYSDLSRSKDRLNEILSSGRNALTVLIAQTEKVGQQMAAVISDHRYTSEGARAKNSELLATWHGSAIYAMEIFLNRAISEISAMTRELAIVTPEPAENSQINIDSEIRSLFRSDTDLNRHLKARMATLSEIESLAILRATSRLSGMDSATFSELKSEFQQHSNLVSAYSVELIAGYIENLSSTARRFIDALVGMTDIDNVNLKIMQSRLSFDLSEFEAFAAVLNKKPMVISDDSKNVSEAA